MSKQKLWMAAAQALVDQDISTMFGVVGDGNMAYLAEYAGTGSYIAAVDERSAISMATGFALGTGGVGFASVTHGPGLTNALTSLTEATRARAPVVLLTSDTPAGAPHHKQRVETAAFVRPTGAAYRVVLSADQAIDELGRSIRQATVEDRPVVLNIPAHLLMESVEPTPSRYRAASPRTILPDEESLDAAAGILASARSPLILAGRGAVVADAGGELAKLSELLQAPLAATVPARNLFQGHPWNLGIMGGLSHDVAIDVISQSDAVVAFGASLNGRTSESGRLLNGKAVVQVGNDRARLDLFYKSDVSVCGDAHATATALTNMLENAGLRAAPRGGDLQERLEARPGEPRSALGVTGAIDSETAAARLSRRLPVEYGLVMDGGRHNLVVWKHLNRAPPTAEVYTNNFGSIGLGLGTAIGFSFARPDMVTVATMGDGGGMMGFNEFATAVRHRLPLAVIVFNDSCYGAEVEKLRDIGAGPEISRMQWPSFAEMGRAMGGRGYRVSSAGAIDALPRENFDRESLPAVFEIITDPGIDPAD